MTTGREAGQLGPMNDERALLARLGLMPGATSRQVTEAHAALTSYLAAAPKPLRGWARRQLAEVEAAYATLRPNQLRAASAAAPAGAFLASDADDAEELLDALDDSRRAAPKISVPHKPARPAASRQAETGGGILTGGIRRIGLALGAIVVAGFAVVGIYKLGEPTVPGLTGTPVPGATAAGVDEQQVLALMDKLAADPKDVTALRDLADLYYAAGDSATSRIWLLKVLEIDPANIEALLGAGATAYNLDDFTAAEDAWQQVLAIDPTNIDAHYDLGLMYFSMDPPDLVKMRESWDKVIELAPDSQLASIVRTHMPSATDAAPSGQASAAPASPAASSAPASPAVTTEPAAS